MCQATHKALNMQEQVTISIGNRNLLRHVQRLAAASSAVSAFSKASAFGMKSSNDHMRAVDCSHFVHCYSTPRRRRDTRRTAVSCISSSPPSRCPPA